MSDPISPSPSGAEWWRQDKTELVAALRERENMVRRAQAETYEILAEMQSRGPLAEFGYGNLETLQIDVLHISRRDAKHRTRRALALHPTRDITGTTPATAPATAQAAAQGAVGVEHIDTVLDILRRIPDQIPAEEREGYEKALVGYARVATPSSVAKLGQEVLLRVDPDGALPNDNGLGKPDRELHTCWTRSGHLNLRGRLDRESGHALEAALSPLSKPRPAEDGTPDARTPGQRNGDALAEMVDLVLREDGLPTEAGTRPAVTVMLDFNKLLDGLEGISPVGMLNGTDPITAAQARRIACDADIIPAVLGSNSEILDLGRTHRLVNRAQRHALNLRDRGCIWPDCPRPARWTQAHHIKTWLDFGPTDIANLCLLCTEHHRLVHHSEWQIVMATDNRPECIPPTYIDPTQTPRRNHAHHPL